MEAPGPPIEWTRGYSRGEWVLGLLGTELLVLVPAVFLFAWLVPWNALAHPWPYLLAAMLPDTAAYTVGIGVWFGLFPFPASRLGLSPAGVVLDFGLRSARYPWSRTFVYGDRLYVISDGLGLVTRYRLTPYQAWRFGYIRPSPS